MLAPDLSQNARRTNRNAKRKPQEVNSSHSTGRIVGNPSLIGKVRFARYPTGIRTQPLQVVSAIALITSILRVQFVIKPVFVRDRQLVAERRKPVSPSIYGWYIHRCSRLRRIASAIWASHV